MMWARAAERIAAGGGVVELCARVTAIHLEGGRVARVTVGDGPSRRDVSGTDFIASMPLSEVVACLEPRAPDVVREAAAHLRYRDFLTVCVIVNRRDLFPDNWIYIHDPSVKVARIQNFKNWSESMSPDPERTSLGLEYFCNEGDALWTLPDADLLALARRELEAIGLAEPRDISDGCVFRVPKAYPVYDETYARHLAVVRQFIEGLTNLQMVGRNGLHRYNNQDHSMLTALYAVRNALGEPREDVWNVNTDSAFLENDAGEAREG
jgi:protoporphyrinogen oxidase